MVTVSFVDYAGSCYPVGIGLFFCRYIRFVDHYESKAVTFVLLSFHNRKYANRTKLAKDIWKLKENKENYKISWSIISSASAYNNIANDATFP